MSTVEPVPDIMLNGASVPPAPEVGAREGWPVYAAVRHRPASSGPRSAEKETKVQGRRERENCLFKQMT